jgi:hypothetical protein
MTSLYPSALFRVFPFYAVVSKEDAVKIAEIMTLAEQPTVDGFKPPQGSSFAVVSGSTISGHKPSGMEPRMVWLSRASMERLKAAWPDSDIHWFRVDQERTTY